jgi:hypothetical protein
LEECYGACQRQTRASKQAIINHSLLTIIDEKEKDFFNRLSKHRPKDIKFINVPGSGEVALPDYYGEKIQSTSDYKKWIKSQRKFIARNMRG